MDKKDDKKRTSQKSDRSRSSTGKSAPSERTAASDGKPSPSAGSKKPRNAAQGRKPSAKKGKAPSPESHSKLKIKKPEKRRPMGQEEIDRQAENTLKKPPRQQKSPKPSKPLAPPKKPLSPGMRRLRKLLLGAAALVVIITIATVLSLTVFFKIEEISVEGETRYGSDDIIASSEIAIGDNLLLCNTRPGVEKIKNDFAYIEDVSVDKKLFNKIIITVAEATPASEIESGGKYVVLSEKGKIIEINKKSKYNVPTVLGAKLKNIKLSSYIEYSDKNLKNYLDKIIKGIKENNIANIRTVDLKDHSRVTLIRDNGFKIILGGFENLDYKLRTAAGILSSSVKDTDVGTLDVSLASSDGGKSYLRLGEEKKEDEKTDKKDKDKKDKKTDNADNTDNGTDQTDSGENTDNTDNTDSTDGGEDYTDYNDGGEDYTDYTDGGEDYTDYNDGGEDYTDYNDGGEDYTDYTDGGEDYTDYTDGGEDYTDYNDGGEDYTDYTDGGEDYTDYTDGGEDYTDYNDGGEDNTDNNNGGEYYY